MSRNVRSLGQSGRHVLIASFSGFDPSATSANISCCSSEPGCNPYQSACSNRLRRGVSDLCRLRLIVSAEAEMSAWQKAPSQELLTLARSADIRIHDVVWRFWAIFGIAAPSAFYSAGPAAREQTRDASLETDQGCLRVLQRQ